MGRRGVAGIMALAACMGLAVPEAGAVGKTAAPYERLAGGGEVAASVRDAREGARKRLAQEGCRRVLDEFQDAAGRPLRANLDALALTTDEYLERIFFYDAGSAGRCRRSAVLAMTTPGSRVVLVCGTRFAEARRQDRRLTEVIVIHEALHTLGLGENPPSTSQITSHIFTRCGH